MHHKRHLSQTSSPLCRRLAKRRWSASSRSICVFQKQPSRLSKLQSPAPLHASPAPTSPILTMPTPPPASPQPASPGSRVTSDIESSDGEENDFLTGEMMPGWEPPVVSNSEIGSGSPSDTEPDPPPSPTPPEDIRRRTWATPKVVQFPDPHAGEPIGSHSAYATSLRNPSPSNPYSPFASKIDWEVAK